MYHSAQLGLSAILVFKHLLGMLECPSHGNGELLSLTDTHTHTHTHTHGLIQARGSVDYSTVTLYCMANIHL
jgi:hypothetical protein